MFKKILIIIAIIFNFPCKAQDFDVLHVTPEKTYVMFFDKNIHEVKIKPEDIAELWLTTNLFNTNSELTMQIKKRGVAEMEIVSDGQNSFYAIVSGSNTHDTNSENFINLDIAEDIKK